MRLLVKLIDIIYALVEKFNACVVNSNNEPEEYTHELGEYTGDEKTFCYYLTFVKERKSSKSIKECLVDIQVIYHGVRDKYKGDTKLNDKLKVLEDLKEFLSQFNINVGDRNLKFDYDVGDADGELMINLSLRFFDDLVDLTYDEEQARELIQNIKFNNEVI